MNAGKLRQGIRFFDKINFFFGEIKVRLHQHPQVDKGIFERIHFAGEHAGKRLGGTAGSGFGAGINQIGNRFRLGEVDFAVQKSTFGKFPGACQTHKGKLGRCRF